MSNYKKTTNGSRKKRKIRIVFKAILAILLGKVVLKKILPLSITAAIVIGAATMINVNNTTSTERVDSRQEISFKKQLDIAATTMFYSPGNNNDPIQLDVTEGGTYLLTFEFALNHAGGASQARMMNSRFRHLAECETLYVERLISSHRIGYHSGNEFDLSDAARRILYTDNVRMFTFIVHNASRNLSFDLRDLQHGLPHFPTQKYIAGRDVAFTALEWGRINLELDVHKPMNFDYLNSSNNDVLSMLNNNIRVNLVNQNDVSMFELYDRNLLDIEKLDTYDMQIPHEVGVFRFIIVVEDDFNNRAKIWFFVHVLDIAPPVVHGDLTVNTDNTTLLTIDEILYDIKITDNVDEIIKNYNVEVIQDNYSTNYNIAGTFNITFSVRDSSWNQLIFVVTVVVEDVVPPTITGPINISRYIDAEFSIGNVVAQLTAYDESDGNITNRITVYQDNFTGNERAAGTHTITFRVEDNAGNVAFHTVTIANFSDVPPVFVIDGNVIVVERGVEVTREELVNLLLQNQIIDQVENVTIESNWFGNEDLENIFDMRITITDDYGNIVKTIYMHINVVDELPYETVPLPIESDNNSTNPMIFVVAGIIVLFAIAGFVANRKEANN